MNSWCFTPWNITQNQKIDEHGLHFGEMRLAWKLDQKVSYLKIFLFCFFFSKLSYSPFPLNRSFFFFQNSHIELMRSNLRWLDAWNIGTPIQNHEISYIQKEYLFWRSKFRLDFIKTWRTCAKNCFLLTALLLEPLEISFTRVNTIKKKKMAKKRSKILQLVHLLFPWWYLHNQKQQLISK